LAQVDSLNGTVTDAVMLLHRPARWRLLACEFLLLLYSLWAQTLETEWLDVCISEEFETDRADLCPATFFVSTVAFDPLSPSEDANLTLILQPADALEAAGREVQLNLPGFVPWLQATLSGTMLVLDVRGNNVVGFNQDPDTVYNSYTNPVFSTTAEFNPATSILTLTLIQAMEARVDTEIIICCFTLPPSSARNFDGYTIEANDETPDGTSISPPEPLLSTPYIDPGFQWEFLQLTFDPPQAHQLSIISLTIRPANDLQDQYRIILHLPTIVRVPDESGAVGFNTAGSGFGYDWTLFTHQALWDRDESTITFFLRQGAVLEAGRSVTLRTELGDFRLPGNVPSDWDALGVEARSFDGIDQIIKQTSASQSSRVPSIREFIHSEISYASAIPGGQTDVSLTFRTNRPMFAGSVIYMRLSGFQSLVVEVPLLGAYKGYFEKEIAYFHIPENMVELRFNRTMYSHEEDIVVTMQGLELPFDLFENDESLLIKTSDLSAMWVPIMVSPALGAANKVFERSQIRFEPEEPRLPSNITFLLLPSITLYEGDRIILHLYDFTCPVSNVPITGPSAHKVRSEMAEWDQENYTLDISIADDEILLAGGGPLNILIGIEVGCRLPDKLSRDDGILRIESWTSDIYGRRQMVPIEALKKVPAIGDPKFVIESRVLLTPIDTSLRPIASISFSLIVNTDVLSNSRMYIKLGGLVRDVPDQPTLQTGPIILSGSNAPLFVGGMGDWNQDTSILTLQLVPDVQIHAGERITFFIERDMYFQLPPAMYQNDPSYRMAIVEAGISEQPFAYSTKVGSFDKRFTYSELVYGENSLSVAYPGQRYEIKLYFRVNVDLLSGTIIRLILFGYSAVSGTIPLGNPDLLTDQRDVQEAGIRTGTWDQQNYTFDMLVPEGSSGVVAGPLWIMMVTREDGWRLPDVPGLARNDPRLKIACVTDPNVFLSGNQIIDEQSIDISELVVARNFEISEFGYLPATQLSIFMLQMRLMPSVNITSPQDIILTLPGFTNALSKINIQLGGANRGYFTDAAAKWNATTGKLTLPIALGVVIPAFQILELEIAESQGFILPATLSANDTTLQIESALDNIQPEPIKTSPMVGNGPVDGHRVCMYQYERGVRATCRPQACSPSLDDPCSDSELERCQCSGKASDPFDLAIEGFQLQDTDEIQFIPADQPCDPLFDNGPEVLTGFATPTDVTVSTSQELVMFSGVQAIYTGYYRMCVKHDQLVFNVGLLVVRPSCPTNPPLVMVDGICVENCPRTKIPLAGECVPDAVAREPWDDQDVMVSVRLMDNTVGSGAVAERESDDPERRYFIYRYTYELARLLNTNPQRIRIASLTGTAPVTQPSATGGAEVVVQEGSVTVNTVFTKVNADFRATDERSPMGLVTLTRALQFDQSSSMYSSSLFMHIDRLYTPEAISVRVCPDGIYRVFCPYTDAMGSNTVAATVFASGALGVCIVLGFLCVFAWRIDAEKASRFDADDVVDKILKDSRAVKPELKAEYAQSFLEGRFMGEEWQRARKQQFLAITHHAHNDSDNKYQLVAVG